MKAENIKIYKRFLRACNGDQFLAIQTFKIWKEHQTRKKVSQQEMNSFLAEYGHWNPNNTITNP